MSTQDATEKVVGKVLEEARKEILSDLRSGLDQALESLNTAEAEVLASVASISGLAHRQAETEKRKILGTADVEARNKSLQLVEDAINRVFEAALSRFQTRASGKGYQSALRGFIEECIDAVGTGGMIIAANSRDLKRVKPLAATVSRSRKVTIKVDQGAIKCAGGIKATSIDRSVVFDNTLDARLTRKKSLLRKQIADLISKG